ncbi:hypothetical protein Ahy_A07g036848 isoform D [Arachis hypogaea]|uniref:Uncharacterized protein n=1 Tax=Arachis hypogaea TaxID=3818 RepID=A0A445CH26_ARAHY|nr:hypothetical protein Ahy_A07g036848 isoform D [Arachis hypogaea]
MTLTAAALFTQTQSLSPALSLSPRTTLVGQPPSNPLSPPSALTLYRKPSVDAHSLSQTLNRHSSLHGSAPVALSYPSLKSSRRHLPLPHSLHLRQPLLAFTAPCGSAQLLLCGEPEPFRNKKQVVEAIGGNPFSGVSHANVSP